MTTNNEQRGHLRTMLDAQVTFKVTDKESDLYDGKCIDISATGISIETNNYFEKNTRLSAELTSLSMPLPPLHLSGKVVRCKATGQGAYVVAVQV